MQRVYNVKKARFWDERKSQREISRNYAARHMALKLEPPEKRRGGPRHLSTDLNTALLANDSRANDESAHACTRVPRDYFA